LIPVTKPFAAPIEEFHEVTRGIWERNWFTNNGPLVNDLELKLKQHLGLKHLLFLGNGTIAIQIALKALNITRKVITTPFSYVATTSSLVWEGCRPVFADIDPKTFNIDPAKIEEVIDDDTEAILATHCFGNPCEIDKIQQIAQKHNLKVIYDAAHCFGSTYKGESVFAYGDISTVSFHATKLFHTVEGGAVITQDSSLLKSMSHLRNFGHDGPEVFNGIGINGKNSELHAAVGVVNLRYIQSILERRRKQSGNYDELLTGLDVVKQSPTPGGEINHSYYPIVFESESLLKKMKLSLEKSQIFPRRYFYPSLNLLGYVEGSCPIAEDISSRILCLPVYHTLSLEEQEMIARVLLRVQNN
jgi:dTDP-4-amino-4,6-dideoxygalactose transaminase